MAKREDTSIRDSLTRLLPPVRIRRLAVETGALQRRRKVDVAALIYSLVLGFAAGSERTIAGLRRAFERATGESLAPSAFYGRFTAPLVRLLERLVAEVLARLAAKARPLCGLLSRFREVLACDSTLLRLHAALEELYPSVWTNHTKASAKLSVVMNVAGRGAKSILVTPGSTHDLGTLRCGPWLRGRLLAFDLGFFRSELFREIGRCGGYYLTRLKKHNNPLVLATRRVEHLWAVGRRLTDVLAELRTDLLDLDVELRYVLRGGPRKGSHTLVARVLGVRDPETGELRLYVTNAPATHLEARHVAAIYAARWEIELLFRELKMRYRIDQTKSCNRHVAEALIYASVLTLLVARRLHRWLVAHRPDLADRVPFDRWAALVETFAHDILDILVGPREIQLALARRLKRLLLHEAVDPNRWRMHLVERAQCGTLLERRGSA
jgi:putative transposase